jgi:hypothetical protein
LDRGDGAAKRLPESWVRVLASKGGEFSIKSDYPAFRH